MIIACLFHENILEETIDTHGWAIHRYYVVFVSAQSKCINLPTHILQVSGKPRSWSSTTQFWQIADAAASAHTSYSIRN